MRRLTGHIERERIAAVLDIGTHKFACLIAKIGAGWGGSAKASTSSPTRTPVRILGYGQQAASGITRGEITDMDKAERAIRMAVAKAERLAGMSVQSVYAVFSGGRLDSESFRASLAVRERVVSSDHIARALYAARDHAQRKGRAVLHTLPVAYGLDHMTAIKDPRGMAGTMLKVEVLAVTAEAGSIRNLALCIERAHLRLAGLIAAPLASALAVISEPEVELGVACIDMGAGATKLAVLGDGAFLHFDSLGRGGDRLTHDLARTLSTPISEAERLKTLYASVFSEPADNRATPVCSLVGESGEPRYIYPAKADIAAVVQMRVEDMFIEARERLEALGLGAEGERVVLTGGGSELLGCAELAARIFGRHVRLGRPEPVPGLAPGAELAFSGALGALSYLRREVYSREPAAGGALRPPEDGDLELGYLGRVGQWLRESF